MKLFLARRKAVFPLVMVLVLIGWVAAQSTVQVGYGMYTADTGSRLPVGAALFRFNDSGGVVVSEAGVGAAEPIRNGRIFVDQVGTKMGLALVNANPAAASITFILRNAAGVEVARRPQSLGANQHMATYVSDLFPSESAGMRGSLTFESSQALAASDCPRKQFRARHVSRGGRNCDSQS